MTIEDFFTFSELNNGLTNTSRVTELVAIIEKETDSSCKNAGDLTKQWSTFARAITSTENKECLDLFVQLDGLKFIAKLLGNAQRLVSEENDTSIEDTITNLLQAVETFQVDRKKLLDSELLTIVKELLVHSSPKVHVRARVLCEHWENNRVSEDISLVDKERSSTLTDDGKGENQNIKKGSDSYSSLGNTDMSQEPTDKEKTQELTRDETSPSTTGDIVEDNMDGLRNNSDIILDSIEIEKTTVESAVSKIEQLMSHEEPRPSEGTSDTESSKNLCDAPSPMGLTIDTDVKVPSDASGDVKECEGRFQDLKEFGRLRTVNEADGQVKRRNLLTSGCDLASSYGLGKKSTTDSEATAKSGKRSDNNFDYGIVDPLDIARQVAIEVEKEVGDYRERSCNSQENNTQQPPETSESVSREEFNGSGDDSNYRSNIDSDNDSKTHEETMSQNTDAEQINDVQNMAVSLVSEGVTTETNSQKNLCDFDLNQVSSEDAENPTSHDCTPVSIVSASRATAALALPGPPLQSDGNLGWKSSASSAFQPEKKTHGGESSGSKKHEVFLGFDLNVAEDWDSGYYHHNGESYAETSSRKPEVFSLDLNHASEPNNGPPRDWLATGNFLPTQSVGQQTSSSSKQPISFLDLNDKPSLLNSSSYNSNICRLPPAFDAFGVSKPKETEFSLFGAKVEVKAKGSVHTPTMSLQNGRAHDLAYNPNNMRQAHSFFGMGPPPPMVQYTSDPSVYGYNNMQLAGPTIPLPSSVYGSAGPIPYMVDARGSPAMPQIMGSVSPFPIPFSQPPFAANMMNNSLNPPSNDAKRSFYLNPRTMMMAENGGGSSSSSIKESSSFGQFLNLGQFRSMDERVGPTSQHTVVGQKRKEPENGWENYGFRPHMPPWK